MGEGSLSTIRRRASEIDLARTATSRVGAIVASVLANLLIVAALTRQYGPDVYAFYALAASFASLLPFADLGLGAAVVNATADRLSGRLGSHAYSAVLRKTATLLVCAAAVLLLGNLALYASGVWDTVLGALGDMEGAAAYAASTMALMLAAVPFGIGNRVLQGAGRMREVALISGSIPLFVLAGGTAMHLAGADPLAYALLPGGAQLVAAVLTVLRSRSVIRSANSDGHGSEGKAARARRLLADGLPFMLVSVGFALGFQSHRLLLSSYGAPGDLAEYSVAAQFGAPALAIVTTVGQNLWSRYRRGGDTTQPSLSDLIAHAKLLAAFGAVLALGVAVASCWLDGLLTGNAVAVAPRTAAALAIYIVIVALHQPAAMALTSRSGLWLQAGLLGVAATISVGLSIQWIGLVGASAPYFAFAACMVLIQTIPSYIFLARRRRSVPSRGYQAARGGRA